jgi:hypothetical protein
MDCHWHHLIGSFVVIIFRCHYFGISAAGFYGDEVRMFGCRFCWMLLVGLGCFSDKLLILLVGMELKNY